MQNQFLIEYKDENMAMVYCRGCGKEIHELAPTCPNCGFVQGGQQSLQRKDSEQDTIWMSVTAFVCAVLSFLNWFNFGSWSHDVKVGLWMFSIVGLGFGVASIQKNMKGKVLSAIAITVSALTMLILLGDM